VSTIDRAQALSTRRAAYGKAEAKYKARAGQFVEEIKGQRAYRLKRRPLPEPLQALAMTKSGKS
jgi:hypothetical protein